MAGRIILAILLSVSAASASPCGVTLSMAGRHAVQPAGSPLPHQDRVPLEIIQALHNQHIEIVGWAGEVAILRATVHSGDLQFSGGSATLMLAMERPLVTSRYILRLESEDLMEQHQGLIVYAQDRYHGHVPFVGVAEGHEENSDVTLKGANDYLRE